MDPIRPLYSTRMLTIGHCNSILCSLVFFSNSLAAHYQQLDVHIRLGTSILAPSVSAFLMVEHYRLHSRFSKRFLHQTRTP